MKLILNFAIFFFGILNCSAQVEGVKDTSESQSLGGLNGLWQANWSINYWYEASMGEDASSGNRIVFHRSYIYIEGDSLWTLDYPCTRLSVEVISPTAVELIDQSRLRYGEHEYYSIGFDPLAIENLKANKINSQCYLGSWSLMRTNSDERDGSFARIVFPFDLGDSLFITSQMVTGELLEIPIGRKSKTFQMEIKSLNVEGNSLILRPTNDWEESERIMWYSGSPELLTKREMKKLRKQGTESSVELRLEYDRP